MSLETLILEQNRRIEDLERRMRNLMREARVEDVDEAKGLYKVNDGKDFVSPPIPQALMAGGMKAHMPLKKGQKVQVFSPGGEPGGRSFVVPGGYNPEHEKPGKSNSDFGFETGDGSFYITASGIELRFGGSSVVISADSITLTSARIVTDGKTDLDGGGPKVLTLAGPAARVTAKV